MGSVFKLIIVLIFSVAGSYLINIILNTVALKTKNNKDIKTEDDKMLSQKEIEKQEKIQK